MLNKIIIIVIIGNPNPNMVVSSFFGFTNELMATEIVKNPVNIPISQTNFTFSLQESPGQPLIAFNFQNKSYPARSGLGIVLSNKGEIFEIPAYGMGNVTVVPQLFGGRDVCQALQIIGICCYYISQGEIYYKMNLNTKGSFTTSFGNFTINQIYSQKNIPLTCGDLQGIQSICEINNNGCETPEGLYCDKYFPKN